MAQLRQDAEKFNALNAKVVVVGPENKRAFKRYWAEKMMPFIGLPDPTYGVLKLFGQEVNIFKFGRMPAQAVIDKAGVVRYVHYGNSMSDIPPNEDLLEILAELG